MKSFFTIERIQITLKLAAIVHIVLGLLAIFYPDHTVLWQCIGAAVMAFGLGYFIASFEPQTHWPIILVGLLTKLCVSVIIIKGLINSTLPMNDLPVLVISDLIWIPPFCYALIFAYDTNTMDESAPKKFNDLIKYVKTNQGESLYDLSERKNVLLVFIRHFGCTFCRETVSEIAKLDASIEGKKLTTVFVHMSDPAFANEFFSRYYKHPVSHVSDPGRLLYKSLNLKRGTLSQLFGPKTWLRGLWAGLFKGHGVGAFEGDVLQLGGYFILSRGQIVFEHKSRTASDFFELELLPHA
jgi:hypothetical protein